MLVQNERKTDRFPQKAAAITRKNPSSKNVCVIKISHVSMLRSYVRVVDPSVCAAKEGSGFTHASRTTSVIPNEVRKKGAGNIAIRLFLPHSLGITHRTGQFYTAAHEGSGPRATCIIILHA